MCVVLFVLCLSLRIPLNTLPPLFRSSFLPFYGEEGSGVEGEKGE